MGWKFFSKIQRKDNLSIQGAGKTALLVGWGLRQDGTKRDYFPLLKNSLIRSVRQWGHFVGTSVPFVR